MSTFIANTIIGLSLGGIFALAALGIVLVYRVTGVLNFANGAMGMFSTFVAWDVFFNRTNENFLLSLLAGIAFSIVLGLVLQRAMVRRHASRRVRGFRVMMGPLVPRRAFRPPPRVDSAVLVVRRL